jgi:MFS family permease
VAFLAFTIPLGLGSPVAGALSNRLPVRVTMAGGCALLAAGAGVLATLTATTSVGLAYLGLTLSGVGQATVFNVSNIAALASVTQAQEGMAAGVVSGVRQIGSLMGLAAAGAAFSAVGGVILVSGPTVGTTGVFVDGVRAAMIVTVGFCLAGLLAAVWARPATDATVREPLSATR